MNTFCLIRHLTVWKHHMYCQNKLREGEISENLTNQSDVCLWKLPLHSQVVDRVCGAYALMHIAWSSNRSKTEPFHSRYQKRQPLQPCTKDSPYWQRIPSNPSGHWQSWSPVSEHFPPLKHVPEEHTPVDNTYYLDTLDPQHTRTVQCYDTHYVDSLSLPLSASTLGSTCRQFASPYCMPAYTLYNTLSWDRQGEKETEL